MAVSRLSSFTPEANVPYNMCTGFVPSNAASVFADGTGTSGTTTITVPSVTGIEIGMTAIGPGIQQNSVVTDIDFLDVEISLPLVDDLEDTEVNFLGVTNAIIRTSLVSIVSVNLGPLASISAWSIPAGEEENPENWIYFMKNIELTSRNSFETFRVSVNVGDKIFVESSTGLVNFFINGVYDLAGTIAVTVGAQGPESPQIGDIWINSEADPQEVFYWSGELWQPTGIEGPPGPQGPDGLPDKTGNVGKFLTTNGTDAFWEDVDALPPQTGNSGKYLTTDGTDPEWAFLSGGSAAAEPPETGLVDGSIWLDTDGEVQPPTAIIRRWTKTATESQTIFTGASDGSGPNLAYRPASEQVFLNGVQLVRNDDYTGGDGEIVTLISPAKAGDVLQVINPSFLVTTNSALSEELFENKGDIVVAFDTQTPVTLPVGADGQVLTANSLATNGLEWSYAPMEEQYVLNLMGAV